MSSIDKSLKIDASPNYCGALGGLSAQLQMHQDLLGPDANLPMAAQVVGNRQDVQSKLQQSYVSNFSEGGSLKQLLGQKKADGGQSLQIKDAYDNTKQGLSTAKDGVDAAQSGRPQSVGRARAHGRLHR